MGLNPCLHLPKLKIKVQEGKDVDYLNDDFIDEDDGYSDDDAIEVEDNFEGEEDYSDEDDEEESHELSSRDLPCGFTRKDKYDVRFCRKGHRMLRVRQTWSAKSAYGWIHD